MKHFEDQNFKCEQCEKVESDVLFWWKGNLHWDDGGIFFHKIGSVKHWCSSECFKKWIDNNGSDLIDDLTTEGKSLAAKHKLPWKEIK